MILGFSVMGAMSCKAEPIGSLSHGPLFQTSAESASNALANSAFVKNAKLARNALANSAFANSAFVWKTRQYVKYDLKNDLLNVTGFVAIGALNTSIIITGVCVYKEMSKFSRGLALISILQLILYKRTLGIMKAQNTELKQFINNQFKENSDIVSKKLNFMEAQNSLLKNNSSVIKTNEVKKYDI